MAKTALPTATDDTLKAVYGTGLPVLLYLHDGENKYVPTTDAVRKIVKKNSDEVSVASINLSENPTTAAKYQHLTLPAIVTMEKKFFGMREKSEASSVRPADVRAHLAFLLGQGEDPAELAARHADPTQATDAAATKDVTTRTFKRDVLKSKMPVLVDFWAPWCGPCQQVSPIVEQLGEQYKGRVRVVKVNLDENEALSRKYNIMSIPTVMVFKNGTLVQSTQGAQPKRNYERMLENALLD